MTELKAGQEWKTRAGNVVVLSEFEEGSGVFRADGNMFLYENAENGNFVFGDAGEHDQDLVELVE